MKDKNEDGNGDEKEIEMGDEEWTREIRDGDQK